VGPGLPPVAANHWPLINQGPVKTLKRVKIMDGAAMVRWWLINCD
jgi:hypothetical protein